MIATHEFQKKLFNLIRHAMSRVLLLVVFTLLQYIFDMHFVCSCMPGLHPNGVLYMTLPPLILAFVVNIADSFYGRRTFFSQRLFHFTDYISFCRYFLKFIFKYISLCVLWVSLVLFDGDWYFCLRTNFNSTQTGMPCRKNLTYDDQRIMDHYKTESLDYGLYVSCGFLCVWSITEILRACCHSRFCCWPPHYNDVYENLLAEEFSNHLNEELKSIAQEKAKMVCKHYLNGIKAHELEPRDKNINISEVWKKISAPSFFLVKLNETAV